MTAKSPLKSIIGKRLGLGGFGNLVAQGADVTSPAVKATITISAEGATVANQRDITITLKDADGNAMESVTEFEIGAYLNATMLEYAGTGGSTGIAAGASGKILAVVAKKLFRGITTAAGVCQIIYTDTGTEAVHLGITLPNGVRVYGGVLTNS